MMKLEKQAKFFAAGLDGHSTADFFISTNQGRFEGSGSLEPAGALSHNDNVNKLLAVCLESVGIDVVFASQLKKIRDYMMDEMMKVFFFHGEQRELSESSKILLMRPDVLTVLMYNGIPPSQTRQIPDHMGLYQFSPHAPRCLIMTKPTGVSSITKYIQEYIEDILVE